MSQVPGLPSGWSLATLEDIADLKGGLTLGKKRGSNDRVRMVPYLRVANVQRGFLSLEEVKTVAATEVEIQELSLRDGDILFNEGGDRDKLGRGWIWSAELPECIHQNHVFRARPRTPEIVPKFVSLYSNSQGQAYFLGQGKQTTNLASINLTKLSKFPVPVPPANEQRRIVTKLEALLTRSRRIKEALDAVSVLLDRFRQSVLAAAFRGDLTQDWRERNPDVEPTTKLLARISIERRKRWEKDELERMQARGRSPKDEKWRERYEEPLHSDATPPVKIPETWCWATLDALTFIKGGLALGKKYERGAELVVRPYLRVANVQRGHLDLTELKTVSVTEDEARDLELRAGDVLFNEGGDRDKLGRGWVWEGAIPECIHQNHVFRGRPIDSSLQPKLLSWYGNTFGQRYFLNEGKQTTNLASVSMTKLKRLPVPVIPVEEQEVLVARIEALLGRMSTMEGTLLIAMARLIALEQAMMARAFRGKLVPQDPDDEPASALLARIRAERAEGQNKEPKRSRALPAPRAHQEPIRMAKSRKDEDVAGRPYLSEVLRSMGGEALAEDLFKAADLGLVDFYKQLSWEVDCGFIRDAAEVLKVA